MFELVGMLAAKTRTQPELLHGGGLLEVVL